MCWTDLIQGLLMLTALSFCTLMAYFAVAGSGVDITSANPAAFKYQTTWLTGASLMAWGFGYFGQPHILTRFIGIDKVSSVPKARRVGLSWMVLCLTLSVIIGLTGIAYHEVAPMPGVAGVDGNSERIFLAMVSALFHPFSPALSLRRCWQQLCQRLIPSCWSSPRPLPKICPCSGI